MDAQTLDTHKKILGIIYVITSAITIMICLAMRMFLGLVFDFAFENDPEAREIPEFVLALVSVVPVLLIVFSGLPTLIAGIGLLARQSWATLFALIMGCLKLISFPIGTAIGIYAIWIYSEEQRFKKAAAAAK
jgi:hypothetical protein